MLRGVSLVRKYENPMNNVFVEMIIIKYNVHVTMLFDAMVRGKSDYLICFTVGIVIENRTATYPSYNILCHSVYLLTF